MPKIYRIHPTIGIARFGNSRTETFDGPLVPDIHFLPPDGNFRDASGRIRRQGTKFFVFEYTYSDSELTQLVDVRRLTANQASIKWTVHLANTKSFTLVGGVRTPVPNDPGAKSIRGGDPKIDVIGRIFNVNVQLGTLEALDNATLRVFGGFGESGPVGTPAGGGLHWADWYDDVADGPVMAHVTLTDDGSTAVAEPAWIVTGVSKFATPVTPIVTMYDVALDIAVRHYGYQFPTDVRFTRDIFPVFCRTVMHQWVEAASRSGHGPGRPGDFLDPAMLALLADNNSDASSPSGIARSSVFDMLKNPAGGGGNMPKLIGPSSSETPKTNGLSLTFTQYEQFRRWSLGDFNSDWTGIPPIVPFEGLSPLEQAISLDRANLETGIGGTYGPGIEVGEHFGKFATFARGLRIAPTTLPGYLTSTLSIPWQVDYQACTSGWWPAGRPNRVMKLDMSFDNWARFSAGDAMLSSWWKLGFIKQSATNPSDYIEQERI